MSAAIPLRGVPKRFGGVTAVDRLDAAVPRGSLCGFMGPNGSGKATTLRTITRLLLPDEGEVEVLGVRDTRATHDRVSDLPGRAAKPTGGPARSHADRPVRSRADLAARRLRQHRPPAEPRRSGGDARRRLTFANSG